MEWLAKMTVQNEGSTQAKPKTSLAGQCLLLDG